MVILPPALNTTDFKLLDNGPVSLLKAHFAPMVQQFQDCLNDLDPLSEIQKGVAFVQRDWPSLARRVTSPSTGGSATKAVAVKRNGTSASTPVIYALELDSMFLAGATRIKRSWIAHSCSSRKRCANKRLNVLGPCKQRA